MPAAFDSPSNSVFLNCLKSHRADTSTLLSLSLSLFLFFFAFLLFFFPFPFPELPGKQIDHLMDAASEPELGGLSQGRRGWGLLLGTPLFSQLAPPFSQLAPPRFPSTEGAA